MEEDELTPSSSAESKQTYSDYLDKLCVYYMNCGVSCDEFWNGDYTYFKYYESAYHNKRKIANEEMWLQGRYFADAILSTIGNQLSGKKLCEYPEEPYPLSADEANEQKERKAEREQKKLYEAVFKRIELMSKIGETNGHN